MADNTADFTKKILVDVEIKSEQVKKDIPVLTDLLDKYNVELATLKANQKELDAAGQKNSTTYRNNTKDVVETTQAIRQLKADIREANKYIDNASKAINSETGSIQQNRAVLSLVTSDYVKLGQAEGKTEQATIQLAVDVNNLTDRLKEQEKAIGQTYRNVGNYTDSINKSNIATGKASQGLQTFQSGLSEVRKGMGFLPQLVGGATAQLGTLGTAGSTAFNVLSKSVSGFNVVVKNHNELQEALVQTEIVAIQAENDLAIATELNAKAQADAAAGLITKSEAQAAAVALEEADTVATLALAEATTASTAATGAATLALDLFKVALATTGIGAIIVALATVIAYFTDTNEGAKKLQVVFAELGAIVDTFVKQIAPIGKAIYDTVTTSEGPLRLLGGLLGQAVLPLATIVKLIGDIATGQFKQAFIDAGDAVKQFGTNLKNIAVGGVQTVYDLSKAVIKSSSDIKLSTAELKQNAAAAGALTVQRQTLTKAERLWSEEKTKQQGILDLLKLKIRDLSTTEAQRIQAAKDAKKISDLIYANDLKNAQQNLKIVQGQQALKSKVDFQAITDAKNRVQQLTNAHNSEIQSIQNRESRVEQMGKKRGIQEAKGLNDAEQLRRESIARELQATYEEYGDKVIAEQDGYDKELSKLKSFLVAKKITQSEYNSVAAQFEKEHQANIAKIIQDFQEKDYQRFLQNDNELRNLQIANIDENTARSIAGLKQRGIEQNEELDRQDAEHLKNIKSLNEEVKQLYGKELDEANERIKEETLQIQINDAKRIEMAKQTAAAIDRINKNALDQQNKLKDNNDVNAATKKFGSNSSEALDARQKQLLDNYNAEVTQEGLTAAAKLEIERKYLADKDALDKGARLATAEFAINAEQQIQSAVFDLISQNQQQASEKKINDLEQSKNAELQNTSLTNTEKQLINNKYQKLEDKEKLKAFKANQKLQVANVLINSAVAVLKNSAELGFLPAIPINALTVALAGLSISKILSAKPGFATGGVYESDGKGAALSGYSKHDNMNARLRSGEGIVVSEAMRDPYARNTISAINQAYGGRSFSVPGPKSPFMPGFAGGGVFTDGGNANRYYNQPVINSSDLANTLAYQLINNFPPVLVDVKDIIAQQGILVTTQNRVLL